MFSLDRFHQNTDNWPPLRAMSTSLQRYCCFVTACTFCFSPQKVRHKETVQGQHMNTADAGDIITRSMLLRMCDNLKWESRKMSAGRRGGALTEHFRCWNKIAPMWAMKPYEGLEAYIHSFLTHVSRYKPVVSFSTWQFYCRENSTRYPLNRKLGRTRVSLDVSEKRKFVAPAVNRTKILSSNYTNWAMLDIQRCAGNYVNRWYVSVCGHRMDHRSWAVATLVLH